MNWTDIVFAPIKPFVAHPERVAMVATVLLIMYLVLGFARRFWSWPLLWTTGVWSAYAIWEWLLLNQGANIRVDLILIYPVLVTVTIWGVWHGLRGKRKSE